MEFNIDINSGYNIDIDIKDGNRIDVDINHKTFNVELAKVAEISYINSDYLIKSFNYEDVLNGVLSVGFVPANKRIISLVLLVNTAFDGDTLVTVGDSEAQARLMTVYDNEPSAVNTYSLEIHNVFYSSQTEIKMYFPTGEPTQGEGQIIIYYN
jgi:hypothetical protein